MTDALWGRVWPMLAVLLVLMGAVAVPGHGQDFSIDAQVDREEVEFGGAVQLTISLRQGLGSQFGNRVQAPRLDSIPGFDIASQRSAQNMSIVNGVGHMIVQTVFELVPQQPGEAVIPALSIRGPDGAMHSTKAISIKVLPPAPEEPSPPPEKSADNDSVATPRGMSFGQGIALVLVIIVLTVTLPIILSTFLQKSRQGVPNGQVGSVKPPPTPSVSLTKAPIHQSVEDAQIVQRSESTGSAPLGTDDRDFDFQQHVERLKRGCPEADLPFYREFFDFFRRGLVARHKKLARQMTPDETVMLVARTLPTDAAMALKQIAEEWDLVAFAGAKPNRPFSQIFESAMMILRAIPAQERRR